MKMLAKLRKNQKGFTLVEVIVVAVIVAVLALVAIMLYQGYTKDARKNTAENLAAAAAGYLQAELNKGSTMPTTGTVSGGTNIGITQAAGNAATTFTVPRNASLSIVNSADTGTVRAQIGSNSDDTSSLYSWK